MKRNNDSTSENVDAESTGYYYSQKCLKVQCRLLSIESGGTINKCSVWEKVDISGIEMHPYISWLHNNKTHL